MSDFLSVCRLKMGCAQARPVAGDIAQNIHKVIEMLAAAAREGIPLLVFPEKFLSGYEPQLIHSDPQQYAFVENDPRLAPIAAACQRYGIIAVVGGATTDGRRLFISSIIFGRCGQELGRYHKLHLFHSEKSIYTAGNSRCILSVDSWKIGLAICYDSAFPEHARALAANGCHVYLVSALFSRQVGYHESRVWLPARALDNTQYVLMANHCGFTGGWDTCGGSAIWDPLGYLLEESPADGDSIIAVTLDPERLRAAKESEMMLLDIAAH